MFSYVQKAISSILLSLVLLGTMACDFKITSAGVADGNLIAAGVIQTIETTAELLTYGENGSLDFKATNDVMKAVNLAAVASKGLAQGQRDGGYGLPTFAIQLVNAINTLKELKPETFQDPKNARVAARIRVIAAGVQTSLVIAKVRSTKVVLAADTPEILSVVLETLTQDQWTIDRIAAWQVYAGQTNLRIAPAEDPNYITRTRQQ